MNKTLDFKMQEIFDSLTRKRPTEYHIANDFLIVVSDYLKKNGLVKAFSYNGFIDDLFHKDRYYLQKKDLKSLVDCCTALYVVLNDMFFNNSEHCIVAYRRNYYDFLILQAFNESTHLPFNISAFKLARMCSIMLNNEEYDTVGIDYLGERHVNLFQITPSVFQIRSTSYLTIEQPFALCDQTWNGSTKEWAKAYLNHYVTQLSKCDNESFDTYIAPFLKYI